MPGKSHGQRSLADYSPEDHKEPDATEATSRHARTHRLGVVCGGLVLRVYSVPVSIPGSANIG